MTDFGGMVFVVDDDPSVRSMVSRLFRVDGWQVETFATAQAFLDFPRPNMPSCLVLDVRMPGLSGLELQQQLATDCVDLPIVFMTGHGDIPMSVRAIKAGAVDFLPKPISEEKLREIVQQAIEASARQEKASAEIVEFRERYQTLTQREREVMQLVITGKLNKQIAGQMGITVATVKAHRGRVMGKLAVESVAELVRRWERSGIE